VKNKNIKIEKAAGTGFCFGVRRAITALEKAAADQAALRHWVRCPQPAGATAACRPWCYRGGNLDDVKGKTIAIGAHGVGRKLP